MSSCVKKIVIIIVGALLLPTLLHAGYYKWVDEQGRIHFADNYQKVPEKYRNEVSKSNYGSKKQVKAPSRTTPEQVVVQFNRQHNAIFVNAVLNWKLPVIFHVDTGATSSMITRQDALALGIDPDSKPKQSGRIADGSLVEFPVTYLSSIRVGDAEVNNVEVAIGNSRLLGMNFLNAFQISINAEKGQLVLERKDLEKKSESPSVRAEKNRSIAELENQIEQYEVAIRAKENIIKQVESDIKHREGEKARAESVYKGVQDRQRFEDSDISFDSSKKRKIEKIEEYIERLDRHIEIKEGEIEIQKKQIEKMRDRISQCYGMIDRLR